MAITAVLLAALLATGLSSSIADAARRLARAAGSPYSPLAIAIDVTVLAALREFLTFPLSLYQGFLLERRYGLSLERLGGWLRDHAKAVGLSLILGIAGAEAVYFAVRLSPTWWWLLCCRGIHSGDGRRGEDRAGRPPADVLPVHAARA